MKILNIIALAILLTALGLIVAKGINRVEAVECMKWQQQAELYTDYYLTEWQQAQCK